MQLLQGISRTNLNVQNDAISIQFIFFVHLGYVDKSSRDAPIDQVGSTYFCGFGTAFFRFFFLQLFYFFELSFCGFIFLGASYQFGPPLLGILYLGAVRSSRQSAAPAVVHLPPRGGS